MRDEVNLLLSVSLQKYNLVLEGVCELVPWWYCWVLSVKLLCHVKIVWLLQKEQCMRLGQRKNISSVIVHFSSCPCPLQMQPHKKLILLALHVSEVMETYTEEVIAKRLELCWILNKLFVSETSAVGRKDGRREVFVGGGKEGNLSKQWLWEKVNSLSFVKTTIGRQVTT